MEKDSGQKQNRRQMITGVLRYSALGLLGAAGGSVVAKRRRLLREGKCVNGGLCLGCEVFNKCGLPQALSLKEGLAGKNNGRK